MGENGCQCDDAKTKVEIGEIICHQGGTSTKYPDECPICDRFMHDLGCIVSSMCLFVTYPYIAPHL